MEPKNGQKVFTLGSREFKVSSFSPVGKMSFCAGVCIEGDQVFVVNTNTRGPVLEFSRAEWSAFIDGVKNGEFDL